MKIEIGRDVGRGSAVGLGPRLPNRKAGTGGF